MKKKKKLCKSCGGGLEEFKGADSVKQGFCPYCVNKDGKVKSYKEILEGMIEYIENDHPEIEEEKRVEQAEKWLKETEIWGDKYLEDGLLVEDLRAENFEMIPDFTVGGENFDCKKCMYYQTGSSTLDSKLNWFSMMQKKYGSCGMILYLNGESVGYAQFAPKKELPKLEDFEEGCTDTDSWFISCLGLKGLGEDKLRVLELFIQHLLNDLRSRGVSTVQISVLKDGLKHLNSVAGSWKDYKKQGFEKIAEDDFLVVGEINLV